LFTIRAGIVIYRTRLIFRLTSPERLLLAVILLVAAFLRGHYLLQIEHNVDHAYPVWQALNTLEHGVFPLAGQGTSVLFANPALTGYLYLPFIALTRSPLGAYILVIALNTLAVLLAFRAARGLLGARTALAAAFLLAVNPWVIEYSRTSWVQSLLPFFACALAWLLWPVLLGRSRKPFRRTVLALVVLTLYTETYLLAFFALLPVGLLILIFRRRVPIRALMLGGAIFAAVTILYIGGLAGQAETVQARLGEFSGSPRQVSPEAWKHAVRLVTGEDYELARGVNAPPHDSAVRHDLTRIAHVVVYGALLVGIVLAIISFSSSRTRHVSSLQNRLLTPYKLGTRNSELGTILLLWFIPPILLMSYVGQPVHPFYQLIGLPAGHILAAWGITTLLPAKRWGNWALVVLAVPFAVLMGVNSSRYYQETAATPGAEYLTALSLEYGLQLGRAIDDHLPPGGVVFADADEWILNSFAGRTFPLIRDVRMPAVQIIPPSGALVVQMSQAAAADIPYADRVQNWLLPDGWNMSIDLYAPGFVPPVTLPSSVTSEQGITFLGYELAQNAAHVELTTFWQIESLDLDVGESLFGPFVHVFAGSGERVLIVDGQSIPGYEWRVGDIHVHRMAFDLPGEGTPFTLQIGQYDGTYNRNVIFLPDYTATIPLQDLLRN
jgi:4-amino-4-deoxy-L-arabinose transferase-like glycosyltransferase